MANYNGWTNYETWAVNLWLSNDQYSDNTVRRIVNSARNVYAGADALRVYVQDDLMPDLGASLAADLLGAALSEVNWSEIAEHYVEEPNVCVDCGAELPEGETHDSEDCEVKRIIQVYGEKL